MLKDFNIFIIKNNIKFIKKFIIYYIINYII